MSRVPQQPAKATTHCEWCGDELVDPRPNKRYCDSTCRGEACHERKGRRRGSRGGRRKALQSAAKRQRRQTRSGYGTDLYVVRDEIELVRDLLAGKRPRASVSRDRLLQKIPRALERIERRAA
jgi:hypothetical protein